MTMRCFVLVALLACSSALAEQKIADAGKSAVQTNTNPIAKIIELISNLQAKVIKEGEEEQKIYEEFAEWCEDEAKQKQFEIKTGEGEKEGLEATIAKANADIDDADAKIEELSNALSTNAADLKAATEIRNAEQADFAKLEADLVDTVDILERAIGILEREMAKNPAAALLQQRNAQPGSPAAYLVNSLKTVLEATSFPLKDTQKLTAMLQTREDSGDKDAEAAEDAMMGAPDPAAYKNQSGGIVDVLNGMLEEAESQLADARKKEMEAKHAFELLKQSLEDETKNAEKNMAKAKKAKAGAQETKAVAEGDLAEVSKALEEDKGYLASIHQDCMQKAQDFEASVKSRDEELEALATAKKILTEMTAGATEEVYDAASFLQLGEKSTSHAKLAKMEVVQLVKGLAEKYRSPALFQLASQLRSLVRQSDRSGDDVFAKVKGLIRDMIDRLLKEAEAEASHKAYCDEEMAETKEKKDDLDETMEKLNTKIDKWTAEITKLKEEVATLQAELAALAKAQAEMDKLRQEEHDEYVRVKKELEDGIEGITMALKVLRDYYAKEGDAHGKASGAGGGIIGLLEVAESDFTKNLQDVETEEENAANEYDRITKENEIAKVTKSQDVKYKTKEYKGLEKAVAEATADLEAAETEYKAVMEYFDKIKEECIAKPMPYEEIKKRREAEIAGLKEALAILEGEAVLLQEGSVTLRKTQPHFLEKSNKA